MVFLLTRYDATVLIASLSLLEQVADRHLGQNTTSDWGNQTLQALPKAATTVTQQRRLLKRTKERSNPVTNRAGIVF